MPDTISEAAWIVCLMCDAKKCVGRFNCPEIQAYIKKREEETDA